MYEIIHVNDSSSVDKYNNRVDSMPALVFFYMENCGHCQMMKPEWHKFEEKVRSDTSHDKKDDILIAKINSNYLSMIEGHNSVDGFPTIVHLDKGKKVSEFSKERTLKGFEKYLDEIEKKHSKKTHHKGGSRRRSYRKKSKSRSNSRSKSHSKTRSNSRSKSRRTRRRISKRKSRLSRHHTRKRR